MAGHPKAKPDIAGLEVLIVGGGIGGLVSALELHRRGAQVQILERTSSENQLGDSLSIGPSAMNLIERNLPGVFEDLQKVVYDPEIYYLKYTGEKIFGPTRFGYGPNSTGMARFSRPQLHQVLLKQVEKSDIKLTWGKKVQKYFDATDSKQAGVTCEDGSTLMADLVIAADGVRTASWHLVGGEKPPARSSGKAIFRTAFPLKHVMHDPEIVKRFQLDIDKPYFETYNGHPKFHGGIGRTVTELTWAITHDDKGSAEEHWGNRVHPEKAAEMLEEVPDWDPLFIRAIRLTPPDQLVDWKLMFRDPQPVWHSPGRTVIQLTFCCPTSGNGGTQAIEDAFGLAECLSHAGKDHVKDAVEVHCKLRFERVSCIQLLGFYNHFNRVNVDWAKVKESPKSISMQLGEWIWGHDPESYVREKYDDALQHIRTGIEFKNTNVPPGYVYKPWTLDEMMKIGDEGGKLELGSEWF